MLAIKPAGIESIETVRDLVYRIWPVAYGEILSADQLNYMLEKFYSEESLQHQITQLNHQFLLATENELPIGFASFSTKTESPEIYHLHKIYVLPECQGKQFGKQLLEKVTTIVKQSGGSKLQLNVNRYNKARFFYEKLGYKIIREEDIDIGSGYFMNDFVMSKDL